jgi:phosphoglycerate dehydrogenase-like enzyme
VAGAAARFVRTARRIDSRAEHAVGIVRFSSAFSRVGLVGFGAIGRFSTKAGAAFIGRVEQHDPEFANGGRVFGSSKD